MEVHILLLCNYGQTDAVVRLHQTLTFAELVNVICGKFDGLAPKTVTLLFTILGYNKFKVVCDKDVQNMVSLTKSFKLDHIDVLVQNQNVGDGVNRSGGICMFEDGSCTGGDKMFDIDGWMDLLLSYCHHRSKTYLSTGWASGVTKAGQFFMGGRTNFEPCFPSTLLSVDFNSSMSKMIQFVSQLFRFDSSHTCGAAVRMARNPRTGFELVADVVADRVLAQPLTHPTAVVFDLKNDYGLDISYYVAWLGLVSRKREVKCMGRQCGKMCSNAAESFNNWIQEARHLPITQLVDAIRGKIMEQMSKCRAKCNKWAAQICPKMEKKLEDEYKSNTAWIVSQSDEDVYEVHSHPSILVDVNRRTCSCCQWQVNEFPCSHNVVTFRNNERNIYDSIEPYYHVSELRASYSESIYPIPTVEKPMVTPNDYLIAPSVAKRPPRGP
ncbi:hypothetical protein ACSBR2_016095 [Camellia fascicularis]